MCGIVGFWNPTGISSQVLEHLIPAQLVHSLAHRGPSSEHHKVFADSTSDAFEITARGIFEVTGNTVFGGALKEATDDYDQVMADVDQTRLTKA